MKNRSVRETLTSFAVLGGVYFIVSLIENQLDANLIDLAPMAVRQNESLFWLISLAALILIFIALIIVQNAVTDTPLSRWKSRLKTALEVIAGLLAALIAIFGNDVVFNFAPLESLIESHRPQSSFALLVLLAVLLAAVPAVRFWITWNNLLGIRDAKKLLDTLNTRAARHLDHRMTDPGKHFRLPVTELPSAVQELAITEAVADQPPPAPPYDADPSGVQRDMRQDGTPLWELRQTSRDLWRIFQRDYQRSEDRRQLLILGGAGGGKSTQLYLLDMHLVADARAILAEPWKNRPRFLRRQLNRLLFWRYQPPNYQIPQLPVMLDLSTWPTAHAPLDKWIVEATVRDYGIHRAAARAWMREGKFLPLLDALDVLETDQQPECINAINRYLESNASRPLVVCCRVDEYQEIVQGDETRIGQPLKLRHAMLLEEVDAEDVRKELRSKPELIRDINNDPELLEILRNPLLLSLCLLNLHRLLKPDDGEWSSVLFKGYVENVVRIDTPSASDTMIGEIEYRLAWLGNELKSTRELVFLTSDLQRASLPSEQDRARFDKQVASINRVLELGIGTIPAIVFAGVIVKVYQMGGGGVFEPRPGSPLVTVAILLTGIISALGLGLGVRRVDKRKSIDLEPEQRADDGKADSAIIAKGNRLQRFWWRAQRFWRLLVDRAIGAQVGRWQTLLLILGTWLFAAIAIRSAGALGPGEFGAPLAGLGVAILVGGLVGPDGGLFTRWANKRHPDYLYRNAVRRAFRILLFYTLLGLIAGSAVAGLLIGGYTFGSLHPGDVVQVALQGAELGGLGGALVVGLSLGLDAALKNGGIDALLHSTVRRNLGKSNEMPVDLVRFLNDASRKTLLRRNQRGYTFIVKSEKLRDVFADLYWTKYEEKHAPDKIETLRHRRRLGAPRCPQCERRQSVLVRGVIGFFQITPRRSRASRASRASPSLAQESAEEAEKAIAQP